MAGVVVENLSGKQLLGLLVFLLAVLTGFILIGGYVAPPPTTATQHIAIPCHKPPNGDAELIENCEKNEIIPNLQDRSQGINPDNVVFITRFPHKGRRMSRWFHFMLVSLHVDISYNYNESPIGDKPILDLDITLGRKDDEGARWELLSKEREQRDLICNLEKEGQGSYYKCQDMHLFELGNVAYKYYLINVRLPVETSKYNRDIGSLYEIVMTEIHQNGGFTQVWLGLKSVCSPISIFVMFWFARKLRNLSRKVLLLEQSLFALGMSLVLLNFPVEYFSLAGNMPFMLLLSDLRQGLFYCGLLMFWIVFTGEHILDSRERNKMRTYWRELSAIGVGSLALILFDLAERGMQIANPFHTIWEKEAGRKAAKALIYAGGICAGLYFLFLCVMMYRVFKNISHQRSLMPNMMRARRLHYEGIIYRFKFLMLVTILCAALTVVFYIITQVNEVHWKFSDDEETVIEISSAVMTGIYGLWNIYVLTIVCLYAPSGIETQQRFIQLNGSVDSAEGIELTTPSELPGEADVSLVYTMARKSAQE